MNDHEIELIRRAPEDSDAFMELFTIYKPIVLGQIRQMYLRDLSRDDWLQEASIALMRAAKSFDPSSGSQFGPYYKMVVHSHYVSVLRRAMARKRVPPYALAYLSERPAENSLADILGYSGRNEQERVFALRLDWENFVSELSPLERVALHHKLKTRPLDDRQKRALERVKHKLKTFLADLAD